MNKYRGWLNLPVIVTAGAAAVLVMTWLRTLIPADLKWLVPLVPELFAGLLMAAAGALSFRTRRLRTLLFAWIGASLLTLASETIGLALAFVAYQLGYVSVFAIGLCAGLALAMPLLRVSRAAYAIVGCLLGVAGGIESVVLCERYVSAEMGKSDMGGFAVIGIAAASFSVWAPAIFVTVLLGKLEKEKVAAA